MLTELEIPHIYHSAARNSPKRPAFEAKWGVGQYPYIEDPNTKVGACSATQEHLSFTNVSLECTFVG